MTIKESDQLGLHLHEAERQWGCELSSRVATCILEDLGQFHWPTEIGAKLEFALDLEEVYDEEERHAYKQALGKILYERRRHKREMLSIPFAPPDTA